MHTRSLIRHTAALACLVAAPAAHAQTTFFGFDNPRGTFPNSQVAETNFKAALANPERHCR